MKVICDEKMYYVVNKKLLGSVYMYQSIYEKTIKNFYETHITIHDEGYPYYELSNYVEKNKKGHTIINIIARYEISKDYYFTFLIM